MKKFLTLVFSFIVLLLICIYVFVPGKVQISKNDFAKCTISDAFRILSDTTTWHNWWPEKDGFMKSNIDGQEIFFYKGTSFRLSGILKNSIEVEMKTDYSIIDSRINIEPSGIDSVELIWEFKIPTGISPVSRLLKYREALDIKKDLADILGKLVTFLNDKNNMGGVIKD